MLLKFSVKNNLSFSDEAGINFLATQEKLHPTHIFSPEGSQLKVLRLGILYGANGAGKSNLFQSISMAQKMIAQGFSVGQNLKTKPFKLDKSFDLEPTVYNFDILVNNEVFNYGFAHNSECIVEEWLYKISGSNLDKEDLIFFRESKSSTVSIEFGKIDKFFEIKDSDFIDYVAKGTRPEQLFLTETINRNVQAFLPIYTWFRSQLLILSPNAKHRKLEALLKFNKIMPDAMSKFLAELGTGVDQVFSKSISSSEIRELLGIPLEAIDKAKSDLKPNDVAILEFRSKVFVVEKSAEGELVINQIKTTRKTYDGNTVEFNFNEESHGTQKLIHLFPALNSTMLGNRTVLIDEFELNLHPLVSQQIIKNYISSFKDNRQSQLVLTTHEDNLLNLDVFRKDEIWFVEKDHKHSSKIYSLAEFKPRYDLKVQKHYLEGRFGAIPFISTPEQLGWDGK